MYDPFKTKIVQGKLKILTARSTGKRIPILYNDIGCIVPLDFHQSNLLWYMIWHNLIKEGELITLGTASQWN